MFFLTEKVDISPLIISTQHSFGLFVPINKLNQIKLLKVVNSESDKRLIPTCAADMYFV